MAKVIWTEPAVSDLDAIADYIALDNPLAAAQLVQRAFRNVERLEKFPESDANRLNCAGWCIGKWSSIRAEFFTDTMGRKFSSCLCAEHNRT